MLTSHEIPKQLFPYHDIFSDYPYVLGHLIKLDPQYAEFYKRKLAIAPYSIFDNSCFELGKSIPAKELYDLILEYKPSHYVLPDTLHNRKQTLADSVAFLQDYSSKIESRLRDSSRCPKPIGVVQGESFEELLVCTNTYLKHRVEIIAIPFDCIKNADWSNIRYLFFKYLEKQINLGQVKFHFLGIQNPSELLLYSEEDKDYIYSIDTSSPIINGWHNQLYSDYGLGFPKPTSKLADNLDINLTPSQIENIIFNVKQFKKFIS